MNMNNNNWRYPVSPRNQQQQNINRMGQMYPPRPTYSQYQSPVGPERPYSGGRGARYVPYSAPNAGNFKPRPAATGTGFFNQSKMQTMPIKPPVVQPANSYYKPDTSKKFNKPESSTHIDRDEPKPAVDTAVSSSPVKSATSPAAPAAPAAASSSSCIANKSAISAALSNLAKQVLDNYNSKPSGTKTNVVPSGVAKPVSVAEAPPAKKKRKRGVSKNLKRRLTISALFNYLSMMNEEHLKSKSDKRKADNPAESSFDTKKPKMENDDEGVSDDRSNKENTLEPEDRFILDYEEGPKEPVSRENQNETSSENIQDRVEVHAEEKREEKKEREETIGEQAIEFVHDGKLYSVPTFRLNPKVMVIINENHPRQLLELGNLNTFRSAVAEEIDTMPVGTWPQFEKSYYSQGMFILLGVNDYCKNWMFKHFGSIKKRSGLPIKMGEIYDTMKAHVHLPESIYDPETFLRRLKGYNPMLNTTHWRIIGSQNIDKYAVPAKALKNPMVVEFPESDETELKKLDYKPYYELGQLNFKLIQPSADFRTVRLSSNSTLNPEPLQQLPSAQTGMPHGGDSNVSDNQEVFYACCELGSFKFMVTKDIADEESQQAVSVMREQNLESPEQDVTQQQDQCNEDNESQAVDQHQESTVENLEQENGSFESCTTSMNAQVMDHSTREEAKKDIQIINLESSSNEDDNGNQQALANDSLTQQQ